MKKLGGVQNVAIVLSGVSMTRHCTGKTLVTLRVLHHWRLLWSHEVVIQWPPQPEADISQRGAGRPRGPLGHWSEGEAGPRPRVAPSLLLMSHFQDSELGDMKFFIDKLIRTGFLDNVWLQMFTFHWCNPLSSNLPHIWYYTIKIQIIFCLNPKLSMDEKVVLD